MRRPACDVEAEPNHYREQLQYPDRPYAYTNRTADLQLAVSALTSPPGGFVQTVLLFHFKERCFPDLNFPVKPLRPTWVKPGLEPPSARSIGVEKPC